MDNGWGKQKSKKVESKDALKCIRVKALKSELGQTMDGETKEQQHIGCQSKGTKVKQGKHRSSKRDTLSIGHGTECQSPQNNVITQLEQAVEEDI